MIKKTSRRVPVTASRRPVSARPASTSPARRPVTASRSITAGVRSRNAVKSNVMANYKDLTPNQKIFARQLELNMKKKSAIMGATNTSNIMAKPDFLELLPLFVQKLLITDVFGSVAMKSRQQIVPYFKFIAEQTKGETAKGTVLSSPFVNRQGVDPNFTGNIVRNENAELDATGTDAVLSYYPVMPGTVTVISTTSAGVSTTLIDSGAGELLDASTQGTKGTINYATGAITLTTANVGGTLVATYQYDNETVGPDANGEYGAQMAKGYLQLDEFNLVAEAMELACYWSVYSAFAAQSEYGTNLGDLAKEAALGEITAEINTKGFKALADAAAVKPQYNWDATPVLNGSVVPLDYLNMFKLKLNQAAASVYQDTRLARPNRLIVGSNVASYIGMMNGFSADSVEDTVGPYKAGRLDKFEVYVDPNYDPNKWVMCCKSNDIRRNSALFGEYMPIINTDAIGLANASVQQGYATMIAMKVVNPATVVSGKITGLF